MVKITILGSCRQDSLYRDGKYEITQIRNNLSYPHYTKEILEVIRFCKEGHIKPKDTLTTFRSPILTKNMISWPGWVLNEFTSTDIFVLEIASRICYEYNGLYVHHIATEEKYNIDHRSDIKIRKQTKEEIEQDILKIKEEIQKPFIIVSHIYTYERGERYMLVMWLKDICRKYSIPFINPAIELTRDGTTLYELIQEENGLVNHYNEKGHVKIKKIYNSYIDKLRKKPIFILYEKLKDRQEFQEK